MQTPMPPYGVAIHQAIASGDLDRMRALVAETEDYLRQTGDVRVALDQLRLELEKAGRSS
jgi:hypothetical protein